MKRIVLCLFAAATLMFSHNLVAGERPNILFIMSDDHAAHALSCYGGVLNKTPNIDRIANEGMRFERCLVTNSICTPSRATLLTGKYSHLNGVPVFNRFDGSQPTVAKYMQAAGYHTAMYGKWHLGSDPTGFDEWTILPGQGVYHDPSFIDKNGQRTVKGYCTDIITDMVLESLKNRSKDKPFLMFYHHKAPHRPWDPDEKHKAMFADKQFPEPKTLFDDYATRTDAIRECKQKVLPDLNKRDLKGEPPAGLNDEQLTKWKYQRYMQDYLACVQSMDTNIGRVLDYLDQNGLRDNTIVIYTSDQGFFLGDHGLYDKRFMYEPALKMPFVVRWPNVIKPASVQHAMAINTDFAPTIMDIAGLPVPADMQGRSLVPLMKNEVPADWRTSMYYRYYHDPGDHNTRQHYGVCTKTHKLIYFWKKNQWELFDLVNDPDELKNIYNDPAQKDLVATLTAEMYRLKKELKDEDQFADKLPGADGPKKKDAKP